MKIKNALLLCKGKKFQSQGLGKFAKDILIEGKYTHPSTGQIVDITVERMHKLAKNTAEYIRNANKVPFPDGHTMDAMKNLGDWEPNFMVSEGKLWGVVHPKLKGVEERLSSGAIDGVSAMIEFNVKDSKGRVYDEVITHICATDYPVITGQKPFIPLSRMGDAEVPLFLSGEHAGLEPEKGNTMDPKKIRQLLGLAEAATDAEVLAAIGKASESEKAALARAKADEALALSAKEAGFEIKDGKLVKLAAKQEPETEKERELLARIQKLEAGEALGRVEAAKAAAEEWIKKGIVPPTVRAQLNKLFAVKSKVESLALAADGKATTMSEVDVQSTLKEVLGAIHSLTGVKLSSLTPAPAGEPGEKTPEQLAKMGADLVRSLQPEKKTA